MAALRIIALAIGLIYLAGETLYRAVDLLRDFKWRKALPVAGLVLLLALISGLTYPYLF